MSGKIRVGASVAMAAVLSLSSVSAQNTPLPGGIEPTRHDIEVEVVDPNGAVIPNANVTLYPTGHQQGELRTTDSSGRVLFLNQAGGEHFVWAIAPGFGYGKETVFHVPSEHGSLAESVVQIKVTLPLALLITCGLPCAPCVNDCQVQTITSSLEGRLPLPPIPSPLPPRRNSVARFFSASNTNSDFEGHPHSLRFGRPIVVEKSPLHQLLFEFPVRSGATPSIVSTT